MRRMRRIRQATLAKISAGVVALAVVFAIVGGISYASNSGNEPFLQDCIEYGVVCNELYQTGDMETNFAAGKYQGNGHTVGNTVGSKANAAGVIKIGEVEGEPQFRGDPEVIIDESVKEEVKGMLKKVQDYSESVVGKCDIETPEATDMNNYVIDVSEEESDVVYVDAEEMVSSLKDGKIANGGLKIKIRGSQTVVFNSQEEESFTIPRYTVDVVKGSKSDEEIAESVIWNFPDITDLHIGSDGMHASVIAPKAYVNIDVTGEGWLVCDVIVSTGGEWHMISKKVPDKKSTPSPSATPTEEPKKTPTATPTEEPKKTPTATPTEEPKKTPTATPKSTPSEQPTEQPTEEPKKTPTATPKSTPKSTPSEQPTEEPKKTPTATPKSTPKSTPSEQPTEQPTEEPKKTPTVTPKSTEEPTATPVVTPTEAPTATPKVTPVPTPVSTPSEQPTEQPTEQPSNEPEQTPVITPVTENTPVPSASVEPTATPTEPTETPADATAIPETTEDPGVTIDDDDTPTTTIVDEDTPKAPAGPEKKAKPKTKKTTILDEEVPLTDAAPETGDNTNMFFPIMGMVVSALAMAIFLVMFSRKERM